LDKLIANSAFEIIAIGVNKVAYTKRYGRAAGNPYEMSLGLVLERWDLTIFSSFCRANVTNLTTLLVGFTTSL
jgi:hypothetical protein